MEVGALHVKLAPHFQELLALGVNIQAAMSCIVAPNKDMDGALPLCLPTTSQ